MKGIEEVIISNSKEAKKFIDEKVKDIYNSVKGIAINALSGGVDSSTVTILGHKALGNKLETYFIDNGLMRQDEPEYVVSVFRNLGVNVKLIDAQDKFFAALRGIKDPEEKREAITQTFYKDVFGKLVKESGAKYLIQGTNYTDIEETVAGIKRQHNILEQLGIDTQKEFGYKLVEPLIQLRKPSVREVAKALGLPQEIYARSPFPGPALAARIIGEVTKERVEIVRKATKILEDWCTKPIPVFPRRPFQYLAILHEDRVTGMKNGKRVYGMQIELRCWDSKDAVTATPSYPDYYRLKAIARKITTKIPEVVSVNYNITSKPPSCIEAV